MKNKHKIWHVFFFLLIILGMSASTMLLWNLIIPDIFSLSKINFWQALGLLLLVRILFGGVWRKGFGEKQGGRERGFHRENGLLKKWENMTVEQREEFLSKRKEHFRHEHFQYYTDSKKEDGTEAR